MDSLGINSSPSAIPEWKGNTLYSVASDKVIWKKDKERLFTSRPKQWNCVKTHAKLVSALSSCEDYWCTAGIPADFSPTDNDCNLSFSLLRISTTAPLGKNMNDKNIAEGTRARSTP